MSRLTLMCRVATTFSKDGGIDETAQRAFLQRFVDAKLGVYLGSGGQGVVLLAEDTAGGDSGVADNGDGSGDGDLQGWASLENLSGEDWSGVDLTVVSGNPVTFRQALYDAYYVHRPEVPVEVLGRVLPVRRSPYVAIGRPQPDGSFKIGTLPGAAYLVVALTTASTSGDGPNDTRPATGRPDAFSFASCSSFEITPIENLESSPSFPTLSVARTSNV